MHHFCRMLIINIKPFCPLIDNSVPKFAERMKINLPQLKELPKLTKLKKEETK